MARFFNAASGALRSAGCAPCPHAPRPARTGRVPVLRVPVLRVLACAALLLLGACSQATPSPEPSPATTAAAPTPLTVEVTRVVVTERVVTATPVPPAPCAIPALAAAPEIVVAALLPLSQVTALSSNLPVQVALNVAATEINAGGGIAGKPLRLVVMDTGGRADRAAAAAQRAIGEQCAVALLATQSAETIQAVADVAAGSGTPVLVLEAADDALTAAGAPHLFRLAPTNAMLAAMYGDWLAEVGDYNGDGRVESVLVIEGTEMARAYADLIMAALAEESISADLIETDLPRTDFSSLIARIVVRASPPDSILIRFNGESAAALQRQLVENGIGPARQTLLVATRGALNAESFWPLVGEAGAWTVVGRAGPWATTLNPRGSQFVAQFQAWLDRWPDTAAFLAYDSLYVLTDAVARAASLAPSDLVAALETINLTGAAGRYTFPITSRTAPQGAEAAGQPAWAWHQWLEPPLYFLQYTQVGQPAAEMAVVWPPTQAPHGPFVRPEPQ